MRLLEKKIGGLRDGWIDSLVDGWMNEWIDQFRESRLFVIPSST